MKFTKTNATKLATIATKTLNEKFSELGYDVTVHDRGGRFEDYEFTMKIVVSSESEGGEAKEQIDYKKYASIFALPMEMLGANIHFNGRPFTVVGFLPSRRKNNIQIKNPSGKTFIAPHEQVIRAYQRGLGVL